MWRLPKPGVAARVCLATFTLIAVIPMAAAPLANAETTTVAWTYTPSNPSFPDPGTVPLSSPGNVAFAGCLQTGGYGPAGVLFSSSGSRLGTIAATGGQNGYSDGACPQFASQVVDKNGDVFFFGGQPYDGGQVGAQLSAFTKDGSALWAQPATLPELCPGDNDTRFLGSMVVGGDGNIYGVEEASGVCPAVTESLVSFDAKTGALRFNTPLNLGLGFNPDVMPYQNGLVVRTADALRYFDYAGNELTNQLHPLPDTNQDYILANINGIQSESASISGRTFLMEGGGGRGTCTSAPYTLNYLDAYDAAGRSWQAPIADDCILTASVNATPSNGAVVFEVLDPPDAQGHFTNKVLAFDSGGHELWSDTLLNVVGDSVFGTGSYANDRLQGVDVNGNVVVRRFYAHGANAPLNAYQYDILSGSTGLTQATVDTADLNDGRTYYDTTGTGFADGRLYVTLASCESGSGCPGSNESMFAFSVPGLSIDYPRGALFGVGSGNPVANPCGDAALIGARGSGDNAHGSSYPGRHALAIAATLTQQYKLKLKTGNVIGLDYPAVSITNSSAIHYKSSVSTGVTNLLKDITIIRQTCGASFPIVLAGFSQGAHVIQSTLDKLDDLASTGDETWKSIAGVVLLASPRFDQHDPVARGTFMAGYPYGGLAGQSLVRARFEPITRSYCLGNDPICVASYNNVGNASVHSNGYNPNTATGTPILADGSSLLAWGIDTRSGGDIAPHPAGQLTAYRTNASNEVRVSAGTVYADGSPTVTFSWDLTSNGTVDAVTSTPWIIHGYGIALRGRKQIETTVRIQHADGMITTRQICIRQAAIGPVMC